MTHTNSAIQAGRFTGIGLSTVFRFSVMVTFASIFTALAATIAVARNVQHQLTDPFAAYADIVPGQRIDIADLEARGFSCKDETLPTPADLAEICTNLERVEQASATTIVLWDGVVERLDLKVHDQVFSIGDLTLLWGKPEIQQTGHWVSLRWRDRHISASGWSYSGRFSYFQPVLLLSIGR